MACINYEFSLPRVAADQNRELHGRTIIDGKMCAEKVMADAEFYLDN